MQGIFLKNILEFFKLFFLYNIDTISYVYMHLTNF